MSKKYVLAIDEGTTGCTVLLFNHDGAVCGKARSEFTQHFPKPGWVEHDAAEIWDVTCRMIEAAMADAEATAEKIAAIGITNQRETTVLWDRQSGEPVAPAIVWQDRRTATLCDSLKADGKEEMVRTKTGLLLDPYFSATKINWLLTEHPDLRTRAEAGELAFGTMDSWLVYKLTGGKEHVTDYSNASRTLLYNIYDLEWDEDLIELFNIPSEILPEALPSSCVYGYTDHKGVFNGRIPVSGMAGDQQAALFGQACYGAGRAKNTYGTGSFLLMNTGNTPVPSKQGLLTTIAWGIDGTVEYALEGAIFITGAAIQWLRDGLEMIEDASETQALAESLDSNEGVYFVPALTGLGAPHWDPYARGAFFGITRGTSRAHFARATLESICYQTRDVVRCMEEESGVALKELRVDGGAVVNTFLMQFQSDILDVAIDVPAVTETTALGAAYLAGLAVGFWSSRDEIDQLWKKSAHYEPQMEEANRRALCEQWDEAVKRSRGWAKD